MKHIIQFTYENRTIRIKADRFVEACIVARALSNAYGAGQILNEKGEILFEYNNANKMN